MVTIGPIVKSSPNVQFVCEAYQVAVSGNASIVHFSIRCYNNSNATSTQTHFEGSGTHWGGIDGYGIQIDHTRSSGFLPLGYGPNQLRWNDQADTGWIQHDGNGNLSLHIRMHIQYGTVNEDHYAWLDLPRIPKAPSKPAKPFYISVSTVNITYGFYNSGDNGGSAETNIQHQVATDTNFTQNVQTWDDSSSPTTTPNVAPGTKHFIRYRTMNAVGASEWSDVLEVTTLPAVPPGLIVQPQPNGTSTKLFFSPPGGVTGVDQYWYELWDEFHSGTPSGEDVTQVKVTTTTATFTGLTKGKPYKWRAAALIGTYLSPWSDWQTVTQLSPNTTPGDYFDGSYADTDDTDFAWSGPAHASTSTSTGKAVLGWGATTPGGSNVVQRITGGLFGVYAARCTVITDVTAVGSRFGQLDAAPYAAAVAENANYVGSLYVRLSRQNRVACEVTWMDAAHAPLTRDVGGSILVPANTWTRLYTTGLSPVDTRFASVKVIDVVGTGASLWQGGDVIDMDGAMISVGDLFPYFDGGTPDTPEFIYAWTDDTAPNASTSTRTTVPVVVAGTGSASLVDPECATVPPPPRPPIIPNTCIVETGVWRRSYATVPATSVSNWLAVVPTIEIVTQGSSLSQVRIRIYDNPNELPISEVPKTTWRSEQIISYVPANTVMTLDGVSQRVWAEVEGGDPQAADHLLYGTGGTPADWPVLGCASAYLISMDLPTNVPQEGAKVHAYLTTRT